jgi:flagellar protein FlaG
MVLRLFDEGRSIMAIEQVGGASVPNMPSLNLQSGRNVAVTSEAQVKLITGDKAVAATAPSQATAPGKKEVAEAIKKIEQVVTPSNQGLRFSIDEDSGITVVKLIDSQTQTVLRQIPTLEVIQISKALDKLQGLLLKDKA